MYRISKGEQNMKKKVKRGISKKLLFTILPVVTVIMVGLLTFYHIRVKEVLIVNEIGRASCRERV